MSRILLHNLVKASMTNGKIDQRVFNQCVRTLYGRALIGSREVVGYGTNGSYNYIDKSDQPFPAIRFREETPEIKVLREKEKGDWKNLTIEEKKALYRHSFWKTLAETDAHNGDWKFIVAVGLLVTCLALWIQIAFKVLIAPPLPESMSLENRKRQLRIFLDAQVDPVQGLSSKWDYEKDQWKK